jgi:mRNA interferase MazF
MEIYRGDIFYVRRSPLGTYGSEQDAGRPAVIVSNDKGNKFANHVEIVYLTGQEKKPLPTHATVMCDMPSIALCESVLTVDKTRLGEYIRCCSKQEMADIDRALMISLGLETPVNAAETPEPPPPMTEAAIREIVRTETVAAISAALKEATEAMKGLTFGLKL